MNTYFRSLFVILSANSALVLSLLKGNQKYYYAKRPDKGTDREHIPHH